MSDAMGIREITRRATPELLDRYLEILPSIRDEREFRVVLARARATAAVLGVNVSERLTLIATVRV